MSFAQQTESELIETVQKDVLKYFWDYTHPTSKLSRERLHENDLTEDQNTIAVGGSGFGFMNIIMGVENGFIDRTAAVNHLETALQFLENADRFHGAWPHWLNGVTGKVIPFSTLDDGGDIVETALLCQGLLCIREYFKDGSEKEKQLSAKANQLWEGVEWSWYTKGENVLYWHWSPTYDWQMNFPIRGYNESLIPYILAAASPTYPITSEVYQQGWSQSGSIVSTVQQYSIPVVVNHQGTNGNVGPLFWAHYSFLGLDPRGLTDAYVDYEDVVKNHINIVYEYCLDNPKNYSGYSEKNWGLTASYSRNTDGSTGYAAHQPTDDRGVITPTAALSSYPFTPGESLKYLRYLYEERADDYIGIAGPYDAYSDHYSWVTKRYLAIDQGTIGPMLENYKSQLFWNLFMGIPEIKEGLLNLGFSSTQHVLSTQSNTHNSSSIHIFPNPAQNNLEVRTTGDWNSFNYKIFDLRGREIKKGIMDSSNPNINIHFLRSGIYLLRLQGNTSQTIQFMKE